VPAGQEPGPLFQAEDEPSGFSFDHFVHGVPANVTTPQGAPPGVAVEDDDPLLAVLILIISRINGRLGLDTWWLATTGSVDVVGVASLSMSVRLDGIIKLTPSIAAKMTGVT
jgi:hypothetical protein